MNSSLPVEKAFSKWLVERSFRAESLLSDRVQYSIAIESPCIVCQPRVAIELAEYLNQFDDSDNRSNWLSVTDQRLDQLQASPEFQEMLEQPRDIDADSAINYLTRQGGVILQLPSCHAQTKDNQNVFQVSMSCHEPEQDHHLWINAKRIPQKTLVPMIANGFLDWACNGGDRKESESISEQKPQIKGQRP